MMHSSTTRWKTEWFWGAAIVLGTGLAVAGGMDEGGVLAVTMALVAVALTQVLRRHNCGPKGGA